MKKEKSKYNAFQNSAYMIGLAWKEKKKEVLLFVILIALLEVGANLLGLFVAPAILNAIEEQRSLTEFIRIILIFVSLLMTIKMVHAYCQTNSFWARVDIRTKITNRIIEKFIRTYYSNTLKEDMQKKMEQAKVATQGNSQATEAIWTTLTNLIKNGIGFIVYLFILEVFDPIIIGIIIITTVTSFLIKTRINSWGYRHRDEEALYNKQMNYMTYKIKDATLAKDIRLFGMASWLDEVYQSGFNLFQGFITRREKVYIWSDITDLIFEFLRNGIAYFYLINLVLNGNLSASLFLLTFTAIGGFTTLIKGVLSEFETLNQQSLELSMVREFLEYPEPFLFEQGEGLIPDVNGCYQIELRKVSFAYEGSKNNTLENINLTLSPGEKLAVVGVNGAGKTTLVKLLCGFLDPTEGEVLLNGINIKTYNRRDYYKMFAAVFQDFSIIAGSVSQNVAQSRDQIEPDKVEDCIKKAGIHNKILELPNEYDSKLDKSVYEDGIELSGGQIQRLMLARALYKESPILVLDEPTAALDPIAESEIYQAYHKLTKGKLAIYISHRLASTGFCDRIILLDGNQIAEEGSHEELINMGGKYAEMFEIQSKYYQDEIVEVGAKHE